MTLTNVKWLIVHCSGTPPENTSVDALYLDRVHKGYGMTMIGHHIVILRNGKMERGRTEDTIGQHTSPLHDKNSLSVCLVGGLHPTESIRRSGRTIRKTWPDYSKEQLISLRHCLQSWSLKWPESNIVGHGDLIKKKSCPGFDVNRWYYNYEVIPTIASAYPIGITPGDAIT
jgi:hypothetical protein